GPAEKKRVMLAAGRRYGQAPDIIGTHQDPAHARRRRRRVRNAFKAARGAEQSPTCALQCNGLRNVGAVCPQRAAPARFVVAHSLAAIGLNAARYQLKGSLRTCEMTPHNQRRRDHEDQALRNPEDDEYLEKKAAHCISPLLPHSLPPSLFPG